MTRIRTKYYPSEGILLVGEPDASGEYQGFQLRPYQMRGVDVGNEALSQAVPTLATAPCGSGKNLMELALQAAHPDAWILTPRINIVRSMLQRLGVDTGGRGDEWVAQRGLENQITTPQRFRNAIMKGVMQAPDKLIRDEVHHDTSEVAEDIDAMCVSTRMIGYTATGFRGTPSGTKALRQKFGEPKEILSYADAVAMGVVAMPTCSVQPLFNDDVIEVQNGEFVAKSINKHYLSKLDALAAHVAGYVHEREPGFVPKVTCPTCVCVPSSEVLDALTEKLNALGVPWDAVTDETRSMEREAAYEKCRNCTHILIFIAVVEEGFDAPWLRRMIDAYPTLSPVKWLQRIGRIMRPHETTAEYVCCNRNLELHAYLLEGVLPPAAVKQAQEAFEAPSKRAAARFLGLESLTRFKRLELPLADGTTGFMYNLYNVVDNRVTEYSVLVTPQRKNPIVAKRSVQREVTGYVDGVPQYSHSRGAWQRAELPDDFTGFVTSPNSSGLSDKQKAWWKSSARRYGLNPDAEIKARQFAALPVLSQLEMKL
jgi:superfamily II DNA or RNA helicase